MLRHWMLAAALAAMSATAPAAAQDKDVEARRIENEQKIARAQAEEEKRTAALKVFEEAQAEREKQAARDRQAAEAKRNPLPQVVECQFKSVMSDEDIARCRAVYRN